MRNSYRHPNTFNAFACKTDFFNNCLSPCVINQWINLTQAFVALVAIIYFSMENLNINDLYRKTILESLRLGFSDHKFRHYIKNTLDHLCPCSTLCMHIFFFATFIMQAQESFQMFFVFNFRFCV